MNAAGSAKGNTGMSNLYHIHDTGSPEATPVGPYPIPVYPDASPTASVSQLPATGVVPDGDNTAAWGAFVVIVAVLIVGGAVVLRRRSNRY